MSNSTKILLATTLVATLLTACDKNTPAKIETTSTTATSTTTVNTAQSSTVIAESSVASSPTIASVVPVTNPVSVSASTPEPITIASTPTAVSSPTANTKTTTTEVKFPATNGKSIVTQTIKAGTPEATVKHMMDAMMNGTPQQASSYYQVDEPNFDQVLAQQQPMVKQQLKHLQLGDVEYNKDKTKAIIIGKMTLNDNKITDVGYKLQKINGQWKLLP